MSVIAGVHGALPAHRYSQHEITDRFVEVPAFARHEDVVRALHASAKVDSRHLILPIDDYLKLGDFGVESDDAGLFHTGCAAIPPARRTGREQRFPGGFHGRDPDIAFFPE